MTTQQFQSRRRPYHRTAPLAVLRLLLAMCLAVSGLAAFGQAATGTPGAGCVATIKSRSTEVSPSGAYTIPNVPVDSALHRVRIVCPRPDGTSAGATSSFIKLQADSTASVPALYLSPLSPQPSGVRVGAIGGALSSRGATVQLQVQALLPSGGLYEASSAAAGTTYTSSNPAVATVDENGLVTAVGPGTVVITANNDGLISTVALNSFGLLDSDGDGIPDNYEVANNLNPYDPTDAAADPDNDGLTNLQEYQLGTNPHVADTDGDGLNDGDEVKRGTNPLVADTDNDGLIDGDEVRLGTNPLLADTDGDGIPDGVEVRLGLNPLVKDGTTTVTGHVTQATGSPFVGAAVTALTYFTTQTDSTGSFRLANVPTTLGNLVVEARAVVAGQVLAGTSSAVAGLVAGTTDVGTIQLGSSSGAVTGTVTGPDNQPVRGAAVTVTGGSDTRTTFTDSSGVYAVSGLQPGTTMVAVFDPATSLRGQAIGTIASAGATLTLNVRLSGFGVVAGTVRTTAGTPVGAGVSVTITGALNSTATTDALGHYSFDFVPLGAVTVEALDADANRGRTTATVTATAQTINLDVQYIGRGTVSGTVTDGAGRAVAGAAVQLSNGGTYNQTLTGTTDSLGRFSFSKVYLGNIYVSAASSSTGTAGNASTTLQTDTQTATANITLQGAASVSGTVFRADGTTVVSGAAVSISGTAYATTADTTGRFTFPNVPSANYTLIAADPLTGDRGSIGFTAGATATTVNISLLGQGSVKVTVLDGGGTPFPGAIVAIATAGQSGYATGNQTGVSGQDGTITFNQQLAGQIAVNATDPATKLSGSTNTNLAAKGSVSVSVSLQAAGTVLGTVYRIDGKTPVAGVTVQRDSGTSALTDANGNYSLTNTTKGQHSFVVLDGVGNILSRNDNVVVNTQGEAVTANFVIIARGTVTGHVTNPDGSAAANVPVQVLSDRPGDNNLIGTQTDVSGLYTIGNVPAGTYTVSASNNSLGLYGYAYGTLANEGATATTDIALSTSSSPTRRNLQDVNGQIYSINPAGGLDSNQFGQFSGDGGTHLGGEILSLIANGVETAFTGSPYATIDQNGQQVSVTQRNLDGLTVSRRIYVPSGAYFARYLELLTNPTKSDVTVGVKLTSNLHFNFRVYTNPGSPQLFNEVSAPHIITTSTGDTRLDPGGATPDYWVTVGQPNDADPFLVYGFECRCLAPLAEVFSGPGASLLPSLASLAVDPATQAGILSETYNSVLVPAGQTVGILHFYAQQNSFAGANASATRLVQLPPEALAGLGTADLASIANFTVPANGVSQVAALPSLNNSVSGIVYGSDGTTVVPGAGVSLQSTDPIFGRIYTAGTDNTGAYGFSGSATGPAIPAENFNVSATHPYTQVVSPVAQGSFNTGATAATRNIPFSNTGMIAGTVSRGPTVLNVSGTVTLSGGALSNTITYPIAADGTYTLTGILPGTYTIVAGVTGTLLQGVTTAVVTIGQTTNANITIGTAGNIQGTVTRPNGSLATGVQVNLRTAGKDPVAAQADTAGRYLFTDIPTGSYTLDAYDSQSNASVTVAVAVASGATTTQNLALSSSGTVRGVVTSNDGSPVAGLTVTLASSTSNGTQNLSVSTDGGGSFIFNNVTPGSLTVHTSNAGGLQATATGSLPLAGQTVVLNLNLTAVGSVSGTVFQGNGKTPAAGIQVTLSPAPLQGPAMTTTDGSGVYRYTAVGLGSFNLAAVNTANGDQGSANGSIQANGQARTVNITLNGFGNLAVRVVNASSTGISGSAVVMQNQTLGIRYTANTDSTGTATFTNVAAGAYTLSATDPVTKLSAQSSGTLAAGASQTVTVMLATGGTIQGTVFDVDGVTPVGNATVSVPYGPSTTTAADGTYRFTSQPLAQYTLYVTDSSGVLRDREGPIYLSNNGDTLTQNLTFLGVGKVHGTVRNADSSPYINGSLTLVAKNAKIGFTRNITTGGDGTYSASGLPVGAFTVTVNNPPTNTTGYASSAIAQNGDNISLDITLFSNTVTLPALLNDADGFPYQVQTTGSYANPRSYNGLDALNGVGNLLLSTASSSGGFGQGGSPVTAVQSLNGRQVELTQTDTVPGINVTRKVYVPTDGYFARRFDVLTNTTSAPITVTAAYSGTERQLINVSPVLVSTSNANQTVDKTVLWLVDDDDSGNKPTPLSQPPVATIMTGTGAATGLATASSTVTNQFSGGNNSYYYQYLNYSFQPVTVPANGSVGLLIFNAQESTQATAISAAKRLVQLPAEALAGLSSTDLASVVNFAVPASPLTAIAAPTSSVVLNGIVYAGDGTTPIPLPNVLAQSTNPYFGTGVQATGNASGDYLLPSLSADAYAVEAIDPATGVMSVAATGTLSGANPQTQNVLFTGTGIVQGLVKGTGTTVFANGNIYDRFPCPGAYCNNGASINYGADGVFQFLTIPAGTNGLSTNVYTQQGASYYLSTNFDVAANITTHFTFNTPATGNINGMVTTANGSAAAGVPVYIAPINGNSGGLYQSTTTDANGNYVFRSTTVSAYTVTARDPSTGGTVSKTTTVTADNTSIVNLQFVGKGSMVVTVRYANGNTGQNVQLAIATSTNSTFVNASSLTDANGQYTFSNVPTGAYSIRAYYPSQNFYSTTQGSLNTDGQTVNQAVTLTPVGTVSGTVSNADGSVAAGAYVCLSDSLSQFSTCVQTDSAGGYASYPVPADRTLSILSDLANNGARKFQARAVNQKVPGDGQTLTVNLRYPGAATVHVTAYQSGATTYTNGTITLISSDGVQRYSVSTTDGTATFPNVAEATLTASFNVCCSSFNAGSKVFKIRPADDGTTVEVAIQTSPKGTVSGQVYASDGTTVIRDGYSINLLDIDPNTSTSLSPSGGAGYSFAAVQVGASGFSLTAALNSGAAKTSVNGNITTDGQVYTHDFVLPVSSISGTVTLYDGKTAVPNAQVYITQTIGGNVTSFSTDADANGTFQISGPVTGTITLTASDANGVTGTQTITLPSDTAILTGVTIALGPVGTVSGTVYDAAGQVQTYTQVQINSSGNGGFYTTVTTDGGGVYLANDIPTGTVTAYVTLPDGTTASGTGTLNNNGDSTTVNIGNPPVATSGRVFGTVYDGNQQPAVGATVTVTAADGSHTATATTDAKGAYVTGGFSAGDISASATLTDGTTAGPVVGTITDAGVAVEVDLGLSDPGHVQGLVYDAGNHPLSGVEVLVTSSGDNANSYSQTSASDGSFSFSNIAPGTITIVVLQNNQEIGRTTGTLPFGGNLMQNVTTTNSNTTNLFPAWPGPRPQPAVLLARFNFGVPLRTTGKRNP